MREGGYQNIQGQVITRVSKMVVKSITSAFCRWKHRGCFCAQFCGAAAEDEAENWLPVKLCSASREPESLFIHVSGRCFNVEKKEAPSIFQSSSSGNFQMHLRTWEVHFACNIFTFCLQHLHAKHLETEKKYPQNIFSPLSVWLHNKYTIKICSVINEQQRIAQFNCLNFLLKIRGNESIHYAIMLLPIMTNSTSS